MPKIAGATKTPLLPAPPKKNWLLLAGGAVLTLANNIVIQKWGAQWPDVAIYGLYILALVLCVIGALRYEKFLKAGGGFWKQVQYHPISISILCVGLVIVTCYTFKVLNARRILTQADEANSTAPHKAETKPQPEPVTVHQREPVIPPKVIHPRESATNSVASTPATVSTPNTATKQPGPTYGPQTCAGSACAQGPNSQATYNQYGASKLVMTDAQRDAIRDAMKPFAGSKINVFTSVGETDSSEYGRQLVLALQNAGMIVQHSEAIHMTVQGAQSFGVSFVLTEDHHPEANVLSAVMQTPGVASAPIPVSIYPTPTEKEESSFFWVSVQPNK